MEVLESYVTKLPSGLQETLAKLTSVSPITTSVPTSIAGNYTSIIQCLESINSQQQFHYNELLTVDNPISTISLVNKLFQGGITASYYSILEVAATETNYISKASLITKAAEASEVMLNVYKNEAYYGGNLPSFGGNLALLIIFSLFFLVQTISCVFFHQWWFLTCWSCGMILEILGYVGRIWSSQNIMSFPAVVTQLVCLTLAPCFMMAGIYYIIAQLTLIYGEEFSVLKPMQYSLIFITSDVISIILQAGGGGLAATSASRFQSTDTGTYVMVGGLAFQVFTITLFQIFWYIFIFNIYQNYKKYGDSKFTSRFIYIRKRKFLLPFIFGVSVSVVLIFVRSIYRLIELSEGWSSKLSNNENYFMILEGLMVSLATFILTILSPGLAYGKNSHIYIDKTFKNTFSTESICDECESYDDKFSYYEEKYQPSTSSSNSHLNETLDGSFTSSIIDTIFGN